MTESLRLLCDNGSKFIDSVLAFAGEFIEAVFFYVLFGFEAELLFCADLNPKALRVKAVLIAAVKALHGLVSQENILKRASPGVVNAHGIVGSNGAVKEAEASVAAVFSLQLAKAIILLPKAHNLMLGFDECVFFLSHKTNPFIECL